MLVNHLVLLGGVKHELGTGKNARHIDATACCVTNAQQQQLCTLFFARHLKCEIHSIHCHFGRLNLVQKVRVLEVLPK